jgi:hypothetical protein
MKAILPTSLSFCSTRLPQSFSSHRPQPPIPNPLILPPQSPLDGSKFKWKQITMLGLAASLYIVFPSAFHQSQSPPLRPLAVVGTSWRPHPCLHARSPAPKQHGRHTHPFDGHSLAVAGTKCRLQHCHHALSKPAPCLTNTVPMLFCSFFSWTLGAEKLASAFNPLAYVMQDVCCCWEDHTKRLTILLPQRVP